MASRHTTVRAGGGSQVAMSSLCGWRVQKQCMPKSQTVAMEATQPPTEHVLVACTSCMSQMVGSHITAKVWAQDLLSYLFMCLTGRGGCEMH